VSGRIVYFFQTALHFADVNLMYFVCILIYVSIKLPIYTKYIWTGSRQCLRELQGMPENNNLVKSEMHSETVIE